MEEDDEFFDTNSLASFASSHRRFHDCDYVSLSRNTVYHSAIDIEMERLDDTTKAGGKKVSNSKTVTYSQWKDRVYDSKLLA